MVKTRLFTSQIVLQIILGTLVPLVLLGLSQLVTFREKTRRALYVLAGSLTLMGHLCHAVERGDRRTALLEELPRVHDLQDGIRDARGPAAGHRVMILPFVILGVLIRLLPPWGHGEGDRGTHAQG